MVTRTQRQGSVSRDTSREHRAIVRAVQILERAVASPVPGRELAWKQRVRADLRDAVRELERHRDSAEKPGGILAELEILIGRPTELKRIIDAHAILMGRAEALDLALEDQGQSGESIRALVEELTKLIRAHQAHEADLLLSAFHRDIGVGD